MNKETDEMKQYFDNMHDVTTELYERYLANQDNEKVDWNKAQKNIAFGMIFLRTVLNDLPATRK